MPETGRPDVVGDAPRSRAWQTCCAAITCRSATTTNCSRSRRGPVRTGCTFGEHAGTLDARELSRAEKRIARQLHESGVTYNIHSTGGPPRPWALDVLPHIVAARRMGATSTAGLRQRARLLEAVAADSMATSG